MPFAMLPLILYKTCEIIIFYLCPTKTLKKKKNEISFVDGKLNLSNFETKWIHFVKTMNPIFFLLKMILS